MLCRSMRHKSASLLLSGVIGTLGVTTIACGDHAPEHVQDSSMQNQAFTTSQFAGPKANKGNAMLRYQNGVRTLTWSDDFKIPDTPAPHWQVVDSSGNTYLLQRLVVKGDKQNRTITIPAYVKDVAKVQIWCAYAEVVLGEAPFAQVVK